MDDAFNDKRSQDDRAWPSEWSERVINGPLTRILIDVGIDSADSAGRQLTISRCRRVVFAYAYVCGCVSCICDM